MTDFNPFESTSGGGDWDLIPQGPYAARCVRIIEIGKQTSQKYPDPKNKVVIAFTIPSQKIEIGGEQKQRMISNPFGLTISNWENAPLRRYADALCPQGGSSLGDMLGQAAQIYVKHTPPNKDGKVFEKIDSVAALLPDVVVPDADVPLLWFKWNDPDIEVYAQLPEKTQERIKSAVNYPGSKVEEMVQMYETAMHDVPM